MVVGENDVAFPSSSVESDDVGGDASWSGRKTPGSRCGMDRCDDPGSLRKAVSRLCNTLLCATKIIMVFLLGLLSGPCISSDGIDRFEGFVDGRSTGLSIVLPNNFIMVIRCPIVNTKPTIS